jgi:predicted N-acetyltransferase YhbS
MEFTYRKAVEADRAQYLDFANMVFSCAHVPHDFQAMIPKVYGADKKTAHMQNIAVDENGSIRGLVAVMPGELNVMGDVLKTGFVGTVSVHPYSRGEGHMKKLMNMAIDGMRRDGVDLAMLGGQRQRYEYFGFTKNGIALYHTVDKANVRHALKNVSTAGLEIKAVTADDADALRMACDMHSAKKLYGVRNPENFHVISRTWFGNMHKVLLNGEFVGYILSSSGDKGLDISEMALKDYALTGAVVKKLSDDCGKDMSITTADFEVELNRQLAMFEENVNFSAPMQLRVFNFARVIGAFMKLRASYRPMEDGKRGFIIDGQQVTITVQNGKVDVTDVPFENSTVLTAMQAQNLFFNMNGWLLEGKLPMGWAPLPMYLDNVDEF